MDWQALPPRAKAWRVAHAAWAVVQLGSLSYVIACVITRRRDRRLWASVAVVTAEGAALLYGRGDCPMGPRQEEWGDPVPFFELVLPPRAAKAAVPVLAAVGLTAIAGLVVRRPGLVVRAGPETP